MRKETRRRIVRRLDLLDHVENALILVEPDVVVRYGDILESDFFGVFEKRVGSPHGIEPGSGQQPVVGRQVVRET